MMLQRPISKGPKRLDWRRVILMIRQYEPVHWDTADPRSGRYGKVGGGLIV